MISADICCSYVPPDQEGVMSGNQLAGKHPLGARARNLHTTGALVVRFEMPFAVWCDHCKPHPVIIGQGVRFNAEKTKVGNYYSTPIYTFRMKHTVCGGTIEIKTDPQNTAYVVTEGGRKRDLGEDKPLQPGEIAIKPFASNQDPAEKDPFSKLEDKMEDKTRAKTEANRILELRKARDRDWEDPYTKNQKLRHHFRQERKSLEKKDAAKAALQKKFSLDYEILDTTDADRQEASQVQFGGDAQARETREERAIRLKPMFSTHEPLRKINAHGKNRVTRKTDLVAARKASWRKDVLAKARADRNPFGDLGGMEDWTATKPLPSKPSRSSAGERPIIKPSAPSVVPISKPDDAPPIQTPTPTPKAPLVNYSSESE
ncbi:unnamed protein product [Penicillium olsonii]|nr:unnamed protein product [Penicillium olsonii]CAG7928187.1 unnamed protein product [Penicillium olsonii]